MVTTTLVFTLGESFDNFGSFSAKCFGHTEASSKASQQTNKRGQIVFRLNWIGNFRFKSAMKSKAGKKENLAISPSAKKLKSPVVAQVVKAKPDKSSKALKASKAEKANRSVAIVPSPKAGKVDKGLETKASAKQAKAPKVREMAPAIKELAAEKPVKSAKKPKVEEKLRKDVSKLEKVSAQPEISATTDDSTSPLDKTKVSGLFYPTRISLKY